MESDKIQQIIAKLPPSLQVFAAHYVQLLMNFQTSEISAMLDNIIGGNLNLAYKTLVSKMSTEELLAEMDRLNVLLIDENKEALAESEYLKNFLSIAIALGMAGI